jgi:hypothetical protein
MSRIALVLTLLPSSSIAGLGSTVEVLYVAQSNGDQASLVTYNVNPQTAVSHQVGQAITIGASSIDPLTIGSMHLIYVWNSTDVWVYVTESNGVPAGAASQHLAFNFPHPVSSFLVDPDGKNAYAAMAWTGEGNNLFAEIVLFTINASNGALTNTGKVVARYGPNQYTGLTGFLFSESAGRLYVSYADNGPYTYIIGYDFYPLNQSTGQLGVLQKLFNAQAYECGSSCAIAISDAFSAEDGVCCGPGSGAIFIASTTNSSQQITCQPANYAFCGDDVARLNFDPSSRNLFFGDATVNETLIGQIDAQTSELIQSSSSIPGTPPLYFSPDARLIYAVNPNSIGLYSFQASTGTITSSSSVADSGNVSVATATLHD